MKRCDKEITHFTKLDHIWWGAKTKAGQKRYFNKGQILRQTCRLKDKKRILEIGRGDGEFTRILLRLIGDKTDVIATDITPVVIKRARTYIKNSKVIFQVENAEKMNFPSGCFDLICGVSILHHLELTKTLQDIYKMGNKN